jgi:hypothetical protein
VEDKRAGATLPPEYMTSRMDQGAANVDGVFSEQPGHHGLGEVLCLAEHITMQKKNRMFFFVII